MARRLVGDESDICTLDNIPHSPSQCNGRRGQNCPQYLAPGGVVKSINEDTTPKENEVRINKDGTMTVKVPEDTDDFVTVPMKEYLELKSKNPWLSAYVATLVVVAFIAYLALR